MGGASCSVIVIHAGAAPYDSTAPASAMLDILGLETQAVAGFLQGDSVGSEDADLIATTFQTFLSLRSKEIYQSKLGAYSPLLLHWGSIALWFDDWATLHERSPYYGR